MSKVLRRLTDAFSLKAKSGYAVPQKALVYETPSVPLTDVIRLYERDPTCKASVDLLAASAVGQVSTRQLMKTTRRREKPNASWIGSMKTLTWMRCSATWQEG